MEAQEDERMTEKSSDVEDRKQTNQYNKINHPRTILTRKKGHVSTNAKVHVAEKILAKGASKVAQF